MTLSTPLIDPFKDTMAEMSWSNQDMVDFIVEFIWRSHEIKDLAMKVLHSDKDKLETTLKWLESINRLKDFKNYLRAHVDTMRITKDKSKDTLMKLKGYRYHLTPTDNSFAPLYVKNEQDVADLFRNYSTNTFTVRKL